MRRTVALVAAAVVLAVAGRARDAPAPASDAPRREEPTPREGGAARAAGPRWQAAHALRYGSGRPLRGGSTTSAFAGTAGPPPLRAHLLDGCVEPVDPDPPVPDGFERQRIGDRVRVAWAPGALGPERIAELGAWVDEGIEVAAAVTDTAPRKEVTLVVYESGTELRAGRELPEWVHAVYDGALRVGADARYLRQLIRHEATHAQLHEAAGCVPTWLNEGLAKYVQGHAGDVVDAWIEQLHAGEALPFDALAGPTLVDLEDGEADLHYAQSLAMVLWLEEEVGIPDAFDRLGAEHIAPEHLWSALMPAESPRGYLAFLAGRLRPPVEGPCVVAMTDVDALRCLTAEESAPSRAPAR